MLANGEANSVKIHVVDYELPTEIISEKLSDLHIDTEILVTLCILEGLKSSVGSYNELILGIVACSGLNGNGSAVAEVTLTDFLKCSV